MSEDSIDKMRPRLQVYSTPVTRLSGAALRALNVRLWLGIVRHTLTFIQ